MSLNECIDEFIKNIEVGVPIFSNDIYEYVKSKLAKIEKPTFNMTLQRYEKSNDGFIRYQKGIYYKATLTPFGLSKIDKVLLIQRLYLTHDEEVFGYESGPSYMNKIGLTTQIPTLTYVATNKVRYSILDKEDGIRFIKPVIPIDKDNYRYLQLLDILDNKMNIEIEASDYIEILRKEISKYNLNFETLIHLASYYNSREVYLGLSKLARYKYFVDLHSN